MIPVASVHERRGRVSTRRELPIDDPASAEPTAYAQSLDAMAEPISAGLSTMVTPAARRAEIFAAAVPDPRVMIAPA